MKKHSYQKGDRVRITATSPLHRFKISDTATVQEASEHVLLCRRGRALFYVSCADVELVADYAFTRDDIKAGLRGQDRQREVKGGQHHE